MFFFQSRKVLVVLNNQWNPYGLSVREDGWSYYETAGGLVIFSSFRNRSENEIAEYLLRQEDRFKISGDYDRCIQVAKHLKAIGL
jgi:hypothetical protein